MMLPAFAGWQGAKICEIAVNHHPRKHGVSKYGIFRIFKVIIDLITVKFMTGYSSKPNYFFSAIGIPLILLGGVTKRAQDVCSLRRRLALGVPVRRPRG